MLSDHKPVSVSLDINWRLLRKYNDGFPKVETSKGEILELPETESDVLSKDGDDETQALIPTNKSTINPLAISAAKAQRIVGKSKTLIINAVVCTCLLCYLYLFKY